MKLEISPQPWPKLKRSLVAILRGIKPDEVEAIVAILIEEGFEAIEIPLNSPDPFTSISKASTLAAQDCLIGAGTVLSVKDVDKLADAGGRLMVSPNVIPEVIRRATEHNMVTMPGVLTPSEALLAVSAGASGLKFFPASVLGPAGIKAISAVLPDFIEIGAVGGVSHRNFEEYCKAGIRTFGLGSSLYQPGATPGEVQQNAKAAISAYDAVYNY